MINIVNKEDCCACGACSQICSKSCISLSEDEQGFLYPKVRLEDCIDCGLCERVCPVINASPVKKPLQSFAVKSHQEQLRSASSSGGVFSLLAESVLDGGGVVFGAAFNDNWELVHSFTETKEGLAAFRGSKYVQSRIGNSFRKAEAFLKEGRKLLFSGTPCQISALKLFLRRDYDNLLTVDLACHGTPSPMVWRDYLEFLSSEHGSKIGSVNFRDKSNGWNQYKVVIKDNEGNSLTDGYYARNPYMMGFLRNLYLRPSCYHCPSRGSSSGSDITLADFWGIHKVMPQFYDNKGVSLVLANTAKGLNCLSENGIASTLTASASIASTSVSSAPASSKNSSRADYLLADYKAAVKYNPSLVSDSPQPEIYDKFWAEYAQKGFPAVIESVEYLSASNKSTLSKLLKRAKRIFSSFKI